MNTGEQKKYRLTLDDIALLKKMMDILHRDDDDDDPIEVIEMGIWKSLFMFFKYLYRLTVTKLFLFVWNKLV